MPAEIIIDIEGLIYVADWDPDTISQEQKTPLDRLVAEAVGTDMLEDEPLVEELLTRFRERLLLSLEFVNKALASVQISKR